MNILDLTACYVYTELQADHGAVLTSAISRICFRLSLEAKAYMLWDCAFRCPVCCANCSAEVLSKSVDAAAPMILLKVTGRVLGNNRQACMCTAACVPHTVVDAPQIELVMCRPTNLANSGSTEK